jgi:uncharacterized membrane protein
LLAVLVLVFSGHNTVSGQTRGGAVVIIGFIPIVLGKDKESARLLLVLSIALVAILIVLFFLQGQL